MKTGRDLKRWGLALIAVAEKARRGGGDPELTWRRLADSMTISEVKDLETADLTQIPPPPKCW